jgi:glycosyltransferase involved in cell wall biosynthesis
MENKDKIPVTLIIPTLNCAVQASKHLESIDQILPNVREIIAIDSGSIDGTYEILLKKLTRYKAKIISTKPGLYQAWNQAAKIATQPYVYFSTISDTITLDGLSRLMMYSQENELDVIISIPRIINSNGDELDIQWPIHRLAKSNVASNKLIIPDSYSLRLLSTLFIPESIIGSSASNLYKTKVLAESPFPIDIGTTGDVLWAILNLHKLKVGILYEKISHFCWDGDREYTHNYNYKKFIDLSQMQSIDNKDFRNTIINSVVDQKKDYYKSLSLFEEKHFYTENIIKHLRIGLFGNINYIIWKFIVKKIYKR